MARGRPTSPSVLNFLKGDPGKKRRYMTEPAPPSEPPQPPDYLDDIAKEEWAYVCQQLQDMNLLSRADRTSLVCYVEAWSRYRVATEQVKKYGTVILAQKSQFPMVSPYVILQRAALKDVMSFADRFGLTPSARARLAVKDTGSSDAKWAKFVG